MGPVVFRCDAATLPEIGTGHVHRALQLADAIVASGLVCTKDIGFLTRCDGAFDVGQRLISSSPYRRLPVSDSQLIPNSFCEGMAMQSTGARLLIIDRLDTSAELIQCARKGNVRVVTFDDTSEGAYHADLVVNGILAAPSGVKDLLQGPEYIVISAGMPKPRLRIGSVQRIFSCFGGHDERRLARFLLRMVPELELSIHLDLVVGEICSEERKILDGLRAAAENAVKGFTCSVYSRPPTFYQLFSRADLAVVSGGLIAFEASALGVPAVGLPQYEHQLDTLSKLESLGALKVGADGIHLSNSYFSGCIKEVIDDGLCRKTMSAVGPKVVDGKGTTRVVHSIEQLYNEVRKL